jgi:tRNA-dihydrouridine synthase 3
MANGHESNASTDLDTSGQPPAKKLRLDGSSTVSAPIERPRGTAPVKAEFLVLATGSKGLAVQDDDAAEAAPHQEREGEPKKRKREKNSGQHKARKFERSQDEKALCPTRIFHPEFSPEECSFGIRCRYEHDLRKYLKEYKREDLKSFNSVCPAWDARGKCPSGWKCRFVGSHMVERETTDGRRELILVEDEERKQNAKRSGVNEDCIVNAISTVDRIALSKRKTQTPKADAFISWSEKTSRELEKGIHSGNKERDSTPLSHPKPRESAKELGNPEESVQAAVTAAVKDGDLVEQEQKENHRAQYTEPPFLPSEKRRLYFGPETPVLAPLTTQGNLPFRRLCVELGAQLTYSEMVMSVPLIQGSKPEWALMKAHESEIVPPTISPEASVVAGYDNSKDLRFGAQIAASKPWQALKTTEVLTGLCPHLRVIDLNCGCPIDLVYREGAGSALLDHQSKLEKIVRGMNTVSGEIPISVKIRMGTKDNSPSALKLVERLTLGGYEANVLNIGPSGVAAVTLHGRSRQQRYTRQADWGYIANCAALVKRLNEEVDVVTDTIREPDQRTQPPGGRVYFLGNGDCYSYEDYNDHIHNTKVDSVMVARGALIKPWIFEEIHKGQYLDISATERLSLVEKFARYGLEAWGSDEHGVGTTRRFLLEWLNFTHRYIPVGLLEYLPPNIQDRSPAWKGRNELETLLGSENYKDWIKITEMFLGPVHKDFKFEPKHKSNSYEVEAEG